MTSQILTLEKKSSLLISFHKALRQIIFANGESFYDVQEGKNQSSRWDMCDVTYYQWDAEFNLDEWKKFSATIEGQQKKATEDFIRRQTIPVSV